MRGYYFFFLLFLPLTVAAQPDSNRTTYTIFHRVPKALMREDMETDRPDVTESPYTVDAGHIQYESDLVRWTHSEDEENRSNQYLFNPFMLKVGITQRIDFQAGLELYRLEYHKEHSDPEQHYGHPGSITLRLKTNITGNDSGKFTIAVMPYIKMPANVFFDHHRFEGGIIIPAEWKLSDKLGLGFQEEADMVAEEEDYEIQVLQSVVLSYDIGDKLKIIGETYCEYHFGNHTIENYINCALQFSPVKNFALDGGMLHGLQQGTEHQYYLGIAWRW
jgi:hypothetical protein